MTLLDDIILYKGTLDELHKELDDAGKKDRYNLAGTLCEMETPRGFMLIGLTYSQLHPTKVYKSKIFQEGFSGVVQYTEQHYNEGSILETIKFSGIPIKKIEDKNESQTKR